MYSYSYVPFGLKITCSFESAKNLQGCPQKSWETYFCEHRSEHHIKLPLTAQKRLQIFANTIPHFLRLSLCRYSLPSAEGDSGMLHLSVSMWCSGDDNTAVHCCVTPARTGREIGPESPLVWTDGRCWRFQLMFKLNSPEGLPPASHTSQRPTDLQILDEKVKSSKMEIGRLFEVSGFMIRVQTSLSCRGQQHLNAQDKNLNSTNGNTGTGWMPSRTNNNQIDSAKHHKYWHVGVCACLKHSCVKRTKGDQKWESPKFSTHTTVPFCPMTWLHMTSSQYLGSWEPWQDQESENHTVQHGSDTLLQRWVFVCVCVCVCVCVWRVCVCVRVCTHHNTQYGQETHWYAHTWCFLLLNIQSALFSFVSNSNNSTEPETDWKRNSIM